jgi:hypothetical protein
MKQDLDPIGHDNRQDRHYAATEREPELKQETCSDGAALHRSFPLPAWH